MNQTKALIQQLVKQGITHPQVLAAIERTPRDQFTLPKDQSRAFENTALPILCHQTISQPYIVALMTQALFYHPAPHKILEVGTGSGYQGAILSQLFDEVYSIERIKTLHDHAKQLLADLGYTNIHCLWGDGFKGYPEQAPYDGILVTACAPSIPQALIDQLSPDGGIMVIPTGKDIPNQVLNLVQKTDDKVTLSTLEFVSFVPLVKGTSDE